MKIKSYRPTHRLVIAGGLVVLGVLASCVPVPNNPVMNNPRPGPDNQSSGTWYGAFLGAGAGAVTGAQISGIGAGPGAWVGAGLGAVWGMFSGLGIDLLEEDELRRRDEEKRLREIAWVQEVLAEHYQRRMELHPSRDIFPADLFFEADSVKMRPEAQLLAQELAQFTRRRMPWSRIVIAAYSTASSPDSEYAEHITKRRAEALALEFIHSGIEPRRVSVQGITLQDPLVRDPYDSPNRYRQAIEIIPLDK